MPLAKRKREQTDQGAQNPNYAARYIGTADHEMELANALAQHNTGNELQQQHPDVAEDHASSALDFMAAQSTATPYHNQHHQPDPTDSQPDPTFDLDSPNPPGNNNNNNKSYEFAEDQIKDAAGDLDKTDVGEGGPVGDLGEGSPTDSPSSKPKVGSEEWQAFRRSAHKDVERRRREAINDGINAIARLVPGAERNNKGGILQRAVVHIQDLKDRQRQTEEKNNLAKMMFEQAISELNAATEELKNENTALKKDLEAWKTVAQNAGLKAEGV